MPSPLSYLLTDLTGGSGYGQVTIPAQPENTHRREARGVDRQASRYIDTYGPMKARHGPPLGHGEAWGGCRHLAKLERTEQRCCPRAS